MYAVAGDGPMARQGRFTDSIVGDYKWSAAYLLAAIYWRLAFRWHS